MSDTGTDPNLYEDVLVPVGADLLWGFQLEPWDATGALSATFYVVTPTGTQSFAMAVTVSQEANDRLTQYFVHLTPTQLATLGLDVPGAILSYYVRWTDTSAAVWALGYGTILVPSS